MITNSVGQCILQEVHVFYFIKVMSILDEYRCNFLWIWRLI